MARKTKKANIPEQKQDDEAEKTERTEEKEEAAPETEPDTKSFPIVGIGASAGGLEAFTQFFKNMPPNSGVAFVLIQYLDPHHASRMPELLNKYTEMPVIEARDNLRIDPDSVYVIPPNKQMVVSQGVLKLEPRARDPRPDLHYRPVFPIPSGGPPGARHRRYPLRHRHRWHYGPQGD